MTVDTAANAKVFIIKAEYGYSVSPSPVLVPRPKGTLEFENLSDVAATVSIPGVLDKGPVTLEPNGGRTSVTLLDTKRVIFYEVKMKNELLARGNSAPTIIRDP
jgi:hypothetical protein